MDFFPLIHFSSYSLSPEPASGASIISSYGNKTEIFIDTPDLPCTQSDDIHNRYRMGHNATNRGMQPACSPSNFLFRQNIATEEEPIPGQLGLDIVLGHNTSTYVVRLISFQSQLSDRLAITRRLFTGQQERITIQWICIIQEASMCSVAPM